MAADPIIGKKLGDYIIVDILGHGGMARVYRGLDKKLNRYAAVKVIDIGAIREDEAEYRQRFQNEARAIARLNHSNIVGVYQFDQIDNLYYMAMSFVDGKDLRSILRNHAKNKTCMSNTEILRVIRDIGSALDYAHSEGVIHRDIKPSNIMVTPGGKAILTDFGLALSVPEGTVGNTFGSAHYIAPEQAINSAQAVPQSDIYSLGVVLYEMLTNRVPFDDQSAMIVAMKHLTDTPRPPSSINASLPVLVDQVVLKALDKDPKKRYTTAASLVEAMDDAFAGVEEDPIESILNRLPLSALTSSEAGPDQPVVRDLPSWEQDQPTKGQDAPSQGTETALGAIFEDETITDDRASARTRAALLQAVHQPALSGRVLRLGIIGVIGLIALLLVAPGLNRSDKPEADETAAALANLSATPTSRPTQTASPTKPPATATAARPTDAPTEQPITVNPEPTSSESAMPVLLRYDDNSLTLVNISDQNVDVSFLSFVQTTADGRSLTFESQSWAAESTQPLFALEPGDCFQVIRDDYPLVDQPDFCNSRQGWRRVAFTRYFWISNDTDATFEVRWGSQVQAVCKIADRECALDPRRSS
jgi:hypothetical protein